MGFHTPSGKWISAKEIFGIEIRLHQAKIKAIEDAADKHDKKHPRGLGDTNG